MPIDKRIECITAIVRERETGEIVNSGMHEWSELEYIGPYIGHLEPGEQKAIVVVTDPEYNNGEAPVSNCRSVCSFTLDGTPDFTFDYNGRLVKMWTAY